MRYLHLTLFLHIAFAKNEGHGLRVKINAKGRSNEGQIKGRGKEDESNFHSLRVVPLFLAYILSYRDM